ITLMISARYRAISQAHARQRMGTLPVHEEGVCPVALLSMTVPLCYTTTPSAMCMWSLLWEVAPMLHVSRFVYPSASNAPHGCIAILVAMLGLIYVGHAAETFSPARVAVYFSPNGGATDAVVREVNAATTQILVQAYSFTSAPIAKALLDAHKRGVKVLAVL